MVTESAEVDKFREALKRAYKDGYINGLLDDEVLKERGSCTMQLFRVACLVGFIKLCHELYVLVKIVIWG